MSIPRAYAVSALAVFWSLSAVSTLAWDAGGHETIAAIAGERLNPKAQQAVSALAASMPNAGEPYDSITLACWMDDLKRNDLALPQHGLFYTWHYIDLGIEPGDPVPGFQPGADNPYQGNVVQALKRVQVVLQGGTDPYIANKAVACAMAMHLVGDIHQPLHAATHYFRTAGGWLHHDAGGSKEYLLNGPANDPRFSLHNFWDSAWRASFDDTTGDVALDDQYGSQGGHDLGAIQSAAEEITRMPSPIADLEPHFEAWAEESHEIAQDFAYREITATDSKKYCRLSSGYVARARLVARQRMYLAACRLAVLLNETLGADAPIKPPPAYPAGPPGQPYSSGP